MKDQQKEDILKILKENPIVEIACRKIGVARSSFYRWKQEDKEFAKAVDEAVSQGYLIINDLAESQLVSAIKNTNIRAIIFWLKAHHKAYATKIELSGTIKNKFEELTPEQEETIKNALKLSSLIPNEE